MSTSFEKTHKAVSKIFDDWDPADAVLFAENQPEKPPTTATWMRWSLRPADTFMADVTGMFERTVGLLYVQIFTPEAKGTRVAHTLADKLKTLFNQKRVLNEAGGTVVFQHIRVEYVGRDPGGWIQHNCVCSWSEDGAAVVAA